MELQATFTKSKARSYIVISTVKCQTPPPPHTHTQIILTIIYFHLKQCVAIDAVTEHELVSALQVSVFPEIMFTKAGKILYREKGNFHFRKNALDS